MSQGALKAIKAAVGGVVLLLLVITVARWYGDYRISLTDNVLEEAATPPQGEGGEATEGSGEAAPEGVPTEPTAKPEPAKIVVVLTDGLNFRKEPQKGAAVIRGLDKGEKLVLIEEENGWYHVKTSKGTEGWITASPSYSKVE